LGGGSRHKNESPRKKKGFKLEGVFGKKKIFEAPAGMGKKKALENRDLQG